MAHVMRLVVFLGLLLPLAGWAQTPFALSGGNYSQDFADIANWTNNFAAGSGAANYRVATSVATSVVTQPTVFATAVTSGGVQKGTGNIILLATGSGTVQNEAAFDLLLDFTGRTAGSFSFDYAKIVNTSSATPRKLTLKAQYSVDNGVTFTDFAGYTTPIVNNNTGVEAGTLTIALPSALDNQAQAVFRFYVYPNNDNTGSNNRPRVAIDNIAVTSTASGPATCIAPGTPSFPIVGSTSATVSFMPDATNTGLYTITATPATGSAITATGAASPISLTGLTASTTYSVTVTGVCTTAAGGGATPASAAATLTTTAAGPTCVAPTGVSAGSLASTTASIAFTGDASATGGYTVTYTPTSGTAQTATGTASPIALSGLTPSTTYSVTVTSTCAAGATAVSSPAITFTTLAPNPEINVQVAGVDYLTGSTYAFGSTAVNVAVGPTTFTIQNTSTTDVLNVNTTGVTGNTGAGFSLAGTATPYTIAPASSATFTVTFTPTTTGNKTGTITIGNNDQNEGSYTISLTGTATVSAPTLTSINPSSIPAGQTTTVTFTGTNFVSGATVNFNGGTVTASITNSTTLTADIVAPASATTTTFPVTVTTSGGTTAAQTLTVTGIPAGFYEPFEVGTKGSYTNGSVTLTTGSYAFNGALLGTAAADQKNGSKSARIQQQGTVTMNFNKAGGAGTITVQAANYLGDTDGRMVVSVSNDGGANYTAYVSAVTTLTASLQAYTFTANVAGNVRVRISNTGSSDRISVDDLQISDFTAVACDAPTALAATAITSSTVTVNFTASASAANGYTATTVPTSTTQTLSASATSVSFTGLTPGTAYTVSIVSNCSATTTSSAATVGFSTLALAPTLAVTQGTTSYPSGGTAYAFATQTVGTTSADVPFTLTNSGPDALTITSITTTGDFALAPGTTTSLTVPAGTARTVNVRFAPTIAGTRTGTLVIASNATGGATYTVNLTGNATAATLPDLTVSNAQNVSGNYNNVTVTSTGVATLTGVLNVSGTLSVAGVLSGNCQSAVPNPKLVNGSGTFVLLAGGRLDICDAAGITANGAAGLIQVTGTRTYSPDAIYAYSGSFAQVTGNGLPTQVRSLIVSNGAANGLALSQGVSVAQVLGLTAGNLTLAGNGLTLLSSATGTAVVDNTGGVVNGTATVQRYISSSNAIGYRHYSSPVANTTVNDLAANGFVPTFNTSYNTSATPGTVTPFPTVFGYNETRVGTVTSNYSAFDKGWFSPAASDAMQVNRGYTVNAPNTALVDFVGTLNNGTQNSGALAYSSANGGWQFLGNPYPALLDWNTVVAAQRPGMDAAMYVFQSSGQYGGSYRSYANGVGASPLISAASGYFTRVSVPGVNGAVNLTNTNRLTTFGAEPTFGRGTADTRPQLHLTLAGAAGPQDEAYVYFEAGATSGRDAEYDALKLANPTGLNLASLTGSQELAINGLPKLGTAAVLVPLAVGVPQAGRYTFSAAELANFTGSVTLIDALTGTRTVLAAGTAYAFTLAGTTAPGRFTLEFREANVLATGAAQALAAQIQLFPNPASASFRVQLPVLRGTGAVSATLLNALGQVVLSRQLSAPAGQAIDAEFDVRALAAGVYTLRLNVAGTPVTRKVVVE